MHQPASGLLSGSGAEAQAVSSQLNVALKSALISAATDSGQAAPADGLNTLAPADLAADQNLSPRDFVAKHTTLPSDPAAKQAAQAAITTLSATIKVGDFLALTSSPAQNPFLSGVIAQANLGSLLSTSRALSSAKLQTNFVNEYVAFQGPAQDFWKQLSQDAEFAALVPALQFTMQLGVFTLNNPLLVTALLATYKPSSPRDLTRLDANAPAQLITSQNISVPDGIPGSTPAEQLNNYVNGMIGILQASFPTDYVAQKLAGSSDTIAQGAARVLSNSPGIVDVRFTNIDTYIQQNSATALRNIPPEQVALVTARLKSAQHAMRISSAPSKVDALLTARLDSAAKIAARPRIAFVRQFGSVLGGEDQANSVYSAATQINNQALEARNILKRVSLYVQAGILRDSSVNTFELVDSGNRPCMRSTRSQLASARDDEPKLASLCRRNNESPSTSY